MAVPFPNIPISQSSSPTTQRNINTAQFGNGYELRVPMGINYKRQMWSISWDALTEAKKNVIVAFIESASGGAIINWTNPFDKVPKKYVLDGDWNVQNRGGQIYAIQIGLREVFDIN